MPSEYYSDRIRGQQARQDRELTDVAWGGIVALYRRYIATNWLAEDFPKNCEDGYGPYACDEEMLGLTLAAEIPEVGPSLRPGSMPPTLAALDLLEFICAHASEPVQGSHHKFFDHYHLRFDPGEAQVRRDINTLLARNGMAFELSPSGRIEALASEALEEQLRHGLPSSIDPEFDQLLDDAIGRFRSPDPAAQVKAVEPLWDAFERMKTILDPDKKKGAAELLEAVSGEAAGRGLLEEEMQALTRIGNQCRIRHHEVNAAKVDAEQAEWLFARMYALVVWLHPAVMDE